MESKYLRTSDERRRLVQAEGYGEYLDVMRETIDVAVEALDVVDAPLLLYQATLFGICINALDTFVAVTDLLENGQSKQAMALHRTLFELMIHGYWLEQAPEERSARYAQYDVIHRWNNLEYVRRWSGENQQAIDEVRTQLGNDICELVERYGMAADDGEPACRDDPDFWAKRIKKEVFGGGALGHWHGSSIWGLVQEVGTSFPFSKPPFSDAAEYLEYLYRVVYAQASDVVHASPRHVASALTGSSEEGIQARVGADPSATPKVWSTSQSFLVWVFRLLDKEFPSGFGEKVGKILEAHPDVLSAPSRRDRSDSPNEANART